MGRPARGTPRSTRARPRRCAGRARRADRPLRDRQRLPRRAPRASRGACRRPAGVGDRGGRNRLRRRPAAGRARARRARRSRMDRQEHEPAHPRARRLVGLPRRDPHLRRAAGRRTGAHVMRLVHAVPHRLPDRCARRAADDRRAALHQLSHDRASRGPRRVGGGSDRRLDLRLRRVPGGLPGQCRRRRLRPAPRPAAAAHRVAPADRNARLRAGRRRDRPDAGGPPSPPAECDRGARECRSADR